MPLHTSVAFDHWKLPGKESVQALPCDIHPPWKRRILHAFCPDAKAQHEAVLHRDRAAKESVGGDAEIALVERELARNGNRPVVDLDLRGHLEAARLTV